MDTELRPATSQKDKRAYLPPRTYYSISPASRLHEVKNKM
jgi:hypothetical protein